MKFNFKHLIFIILFISLIMFIPTNNCQKLDIIGSTSIQPVCEELVEEYLKKHNNADINIQGGGSSLAVKSTVLNVADIGMCSKEINESSLVAHELGKEGIVIIVNRDNSVNDLSTCEIRDIFSGKETKWADGSKINVVVREEGSGTLDAFKDKIMNGTSIRKDAIVQNSAGSVKQAIIGDKNAIGFVSLTHIDCDIKNISIDGVCPSSQNILDGKYPLQRPFLLLTNKTPSRESLDFIEWTKSPQAQSILESQKIVAGGFND